MGSNITQLEQLIATVVNMLIPILVALALVYFIWGVIKFIGTAGGEAHEEGKTRMLWGIIALFVIVSIWGIVGYIGDIFGIKPGGKIPVPCTPGTPGCVTVSQPNQ
ncbi:MAG TPA: pilin [Candidatus Paceibacterota bacterium]